jgi:DNA polymerase elongation subunit (family B)
MLRFQVTTFDVASPDSVPQDVRDAVAPRQAGWTPWIRAHGRTADGAPVTLWLAGFRPYLWVAVPAELESAPPTRVERFRADVAEACGVRIHAFDLHRRRSLMGYREVTVARVELDQPSRVPAVRDYWHDRGREVFEADVPFASRFAIDHGAVPYTWVEVPLDEAYALENGRSCVAAAAAHTSLRVLGCESGEFAGNAPLRLAAWDIECVPGPAGGFPNPDEGGEVIAIATLLVSNATGRVADADKLITDRVVFLRGAGTVAPSPHAGTPKEVRVVLVGESERALILTWARFVADACLDVFGGYNTDGFDWRFMIRRAQHLQCEEEFRAISRVADEPLTDKRSTFQNNARSAEDVVNISIAGAVNLDLLRWAHMTFKFRSYTLDFISRELIKVADGEEPVGKKDLSYKLIPSYYAGTPEQRRELCDYAAQDALLVVLIILGQNVVTNMVEMGRVTGVGIERQISSGQQAKVIEQVWRECRRDNILVPTRKRERRADEETSLGDEDEYALVPAAVAAAPSTFAALASSGGVIVKRKASASSAARKAPAYSGATVLEAKKGFYTVPITVLDFTSLYPSIMNEHNLCYSTLVSEGARCEHWRDEPGYNPLACGCVHRTPAGHLFLSRRVRRGILPRILKNLLAARGRAKKELAAAKDRRDWFAVGVLDGRQLALKISANSVYGFTGATVGMLPCVPIAASVTSFGREMIELTRLLAEHVFHGAVVLGTKLIGHENPIEFAADVVYGDSISAWTPVLVRAPDGAVHCVNVYELHTLMATEYRDGYHGDKQSATPPPGWCVWSDSGWTAVRRLIRHYATGTRFIRVVTPTSTVVVTDEHSLLRADGSVVNAKDVRVGDALLHQHVFPTFGGGGGDMTVEEAFELGAEVANGTGAPGSKNRFALERIKRHLEARFPAEWFEVARDASHIDPDVSVVVASTAERSPAYSAYRCARRPYAKRLAAVLASHGAVREAFVRGCAEGRHGDGAVYFSSADDAETALVMLIHESVGCTLGVDFAGVHFGWHLVPRTREQARDNRVSAIEVYPPDGLADENDDLNYAYDLETETHHFAAGVGRLVVHNTDSVMVKFGVKTVAEAMAAGRYCVAVVNAAFRARVLTTEERAAFVATHLPDLVSTGKTLEELIYTHTARVVPLINARIESDISIAFEKVMYPYLLLTQKRYAGGFYCSSPDAPDKEHFAGVESQRRDNSNFTARTVKETLEQLIRTIDPVVALLYARRSVLDLARGRLPLDDLVISKGFSKLEKNYVNAASQAHLAVNRRREAREPGTGFKLGDRIPYVVVSRPEAVTGKRGAKVKLVEAAEDVDYARARSLLPSIDYYVEQQIRKPLSRIFDTVWGDGATSALLFTPDVLAAASTTMASSFGGGRSSSTAAAAAAAAAVDDNEAELARLRRAVNAWRSRPKQQSLFAAIKAPPK